MGMYAWVTQMRAAVEAGHDRLLHDAGINAEPIPEMEFDQALGWESCAVEIAHAAARWRAGCRHWRPAASGVGCQFRIVGSVHSSLVTHIKARQKPKKCGLWPEVNGLWE